MARTIVIVPVFWGKAWLPGNGPIPWTDVDADIRTVAGSYYLAGLADHGLAAIATVQPAMVVQAAQDEIPNPLKEQDVWGLLDGLIDNGTVQAPSHWDANQFRVYYGVAVAPGHADENPIHFGKNNKTYRGASAGYATANSDRAGVVQTYWHEVIEGAANDEIVDDCRAQRIIAKGVRVSRYKVRGRCWPWVDVDARPSPTGDPRIEDGLRAKVEVDGGLCGERELDYHVEYRNWRVTATAQGPGIDPSTFAWSVNGVPIPANVTSVVPIPVRTSDPRPPRPPKRHDATAKIYVEQATNSLVFTTDSGDGNYDVDVGVQTIGPTSAAGGEFEIEGIVCPELDAADEQCREWYKHVTNKLTRDWNHWVDPGDPVIRIVDDSGVERERVLEAIGSARQLALLGQPEGSELAERLGKSLHVEPKVILPR